MCDLFILFVVFFFFQGAVTNAVSREALSKSSRTLVPHYPVFYCTGRGVKIQLHLECTEGSLDAYME